PRVPHSNTGHKPDSIRTPFRTLPKFTNGTFPRIKPIVSHFRPVRFRFFSRERADTGHTHFSAPSCFCPTRPHDLRRCTNQNFAAFVGARRATPHSPLRTP